MRIVFGLVTAVASFAACYPVLQGREPEWAALIPVAILMMCLALFHSLTVRVNANDLSISFGAGLIRRSFLIQEIRRVSIVRTRWYYGWGIRKIWGGWLYNVSGYDAVQIETQNGRIYQIGTDEPQRLQAAVIEAMRHSPSLRS
jgi:hypothetical protein